MAFSIAAVGQGAARRSSRLAGNYLSPVTAVKVEGRDPVRPFEESDSTDSWLRLAIVAAGIVPRSWLPDRSNSVRDSRELSIVGKALATRPLLGNASALRENSHPKPSPVNHLISDRATNCT